MHLLVQLLIQHHSRVVHAGVVTSKTSAVGAQDGLRDSPGVGGDPFCALAGKGQPLQMASKLLVMLTRGSAATRRHALGTAGPCEGLVAGRHLWGMVDGGCVGNRLALVRIANCFGQYVHIDD